MLIVRVGHRVLLAGFCLSLMQNLSGNYVNDYKTKLSMKNDQIRVGKLFCFALYSGILLSWGVSRCHTLYV